MESSFRLAPHCHQPSCTNGSGVATGMSSSGSPNVPKTSPVTPNHVQNGEGGPLVPKSILKTTTVAPAPQERAEPPPRSESTATIPGTWGMAISSRHPGRVASRTIRASPFEPLVHHRKLPRDGTISPLRIDEYYACQQQERLHLPTLQTAAPSTGGPPVHEIRIPTPHQHDDGSAGSEVGVTAVSEEHYKNLYFSSQRELHASQGKVAKVTEENRMLKRHLIEMQKHLFSVSRNKRSAPMGGVKDAAWNIPSSSVTSSKRLKKDHFSTDAVKQQSPDSKPLSSISESSTLSSDSPSLAPRSSPAVTKSVSADAAV